MHLSLHNDCPCDCCSTAGLRSGKYAEELMKEGYTNVRNLEGSILQWVRCIAVRSCVHPAGSMQVHHK